MKILTIASIGAMITAISAGLLEKREKNTMQVYLQKEFSFVLRAFSRVIDLSIKRK